MPAPECAGLRRRRGAAGRPRSRRNPGRGARGRSGAGGRPQRFLCGLLVQRRQQAAWAIVPQQRVGQEHLQRVQEQLLAPAGRVLVVLAEDGMGEVDHVSCAGCGWTGRLAAGWGLAVGAEMLPGAVEVGRGNSRKNLCAPRWRRSPVRVCT